MKTLSRQPVVRDRSLAMTEADQIVQIKRGLFTIERGEPFALPIDHIKRPHEFKGRELWKSDGKHGVYRAGTRFTPYGTTMHRRVLAWARDHVHRDIPYMWYMATLGHDLHVSTFGNLYARHWHAGWANPLTGEVTPALDPRFESLFATHYKSGGHDCDLGDQCPKVLGITVEMLQARGGFIENLGWLSGNKVTDAFVSEEIDELVSATASEYADFDYHEVGTDATAENATTQDALVATTSITRVAGTPTDADPIYRTVGTITGDTGETWEEHGVFNNITGPTMMDRSLTGGQAVILSDQVEYTYELTKNYEA